MKQVFECLSSHVQPDSETRQETVCSVLFLTKMRLILLRTEILCKPVKLVPRLPAHLRQGSKRLHTGQDASSSHE